MNIFKRVCRSVIFRSLPFLVRINPVFATKVRYRLVIGRKLNLKNPTAMTEKMQWLKLNKYSSDPLVAKCIDKYGVRDYIIECGCSEILNELYYAWDNVNEIDWGKLPEKYVLKCGHGCGYNIICDGKKKNDKTTAITKLNSWMNEEYGISSCELVYHNVKRKIICEKYIETIDGGSLTDYKIFCSYGIPKLIYVITGGHGGREHLDYFTTDWKHISVRNGKLPNADKPLDKPKNLDELLKYASVLSKPFPIVRVDLYNENNKIIFGELTFLATGGTPKYDPPEYDFEFGKMFPIKELGEK